MVGCIDDTHIPIIAHPENETDYCMEWKDARWKGSMRFLHQGGAAYGCCGVERFHSFIVFVCLFCVSHSLTIRFTRDELLDIRQCFPVFDYSDALLDVLVGGVVVLVKRRLR